MIIFEINKKEINLSLFYFLNAKNQAVASNATTIIIIVSGQVCGSFSLFSEIASTFLPVSSFFQDSHFNSFFVVVFSVLSSVLVCSSVFQVDGQAEFKSSFFVSAVFDSVFVSFFESAFVFVETTSLSISPQTNLVSESTQNFILLHFSSKIAKTTTLYSTLSVGVQSNSTLTVFGSQATAFTLFTFK